jgi:aminoglycoside/choline kinase family phosphotransferase
MGDRLNILHNWLTGFSATPYTLTAIKNDASFRCYYRVQFTDQSSYIVMDAPPEKENCHPFVQIAKHWHRHGVNVPEIFVEDLDLGFLLLSDFGDTPLQTILSHDNALLWADAALAALSDLQTLWKIPGLPLKQFSADFAIQQCIDREHWFFQEHLQLPLTAAHKSLFAMVYELWGEAIAAQPLVAMHRDYHCNNLMVLSQASPCLGILDFQDAMHGPLLHDVVSLFLDRYPIWPEEIISASLRKYFEQMQKSDVLSSSILYAEFKRWFDFTGMQRHFRILGNFTRLCHRDHKPGYLNFLPTFLNYIIQAAAPYPELALFHALLVNDIAPRLDTALQRATTQESLV